VNRDGAHVHHEFVAVFEGVFPDLLPCLLELRPQLLFLLVGQRRLEHGEETPVRIANAALLAGTIEGVSDVSRNLRHG
jgi:hypothetical protein